MSSFKALGATTAVARVTTLEPVTYSKSDLAILKPKAGVYSSSIRLGHYDHHQQQHHHHQFCHQYHYRCVQQHQQQRQWYCTSQLERQQKYSNCLTLLRRDHYHSHQNEKQHGRLLRQAFFSTFLLRKASSSPKTTLYAPDTMKLSFSSSASISASASATATTTTAAMANDRARTAQAGQPYGSKQPVLNWNEFLLLRRRRRVTGLVFSIVTALACTGSGMYVTTMRDLDAAAAAAMGLDPIIVLAISTLSFAGIGWLSGPFLGNIFFAAFARRRGVWKEFVAKDRSFLHRIRARRVDPSSASIQNPVPDYYGEKIGSVADYRRWLKDQRAFNLKRGDRIGSAVAGSVGTASEPVASAASRKLPRK